MLSQRANSYQGKGAPGLSSRLSPAQRRLATLLPGPTPLANTLAISKEYIQNLQSEEEPWQAEGAHLVRMGCFAMPSLFTSLQSFLNFENGISLRPNLPYLFSMSFFFFISRKHMKVLCKLWNNSCSCSFYTGYWFFFLSQHIKKHCPQRPQAGKKAGSPQEGEVWHFFTLLPTPHPK